MLVKPKPLPSLSGLVRPQFFHHVYFTGGEMDMSRLHVHLVMHGVAWVNALPLKDLGLLHVGPAHLLGPTDTSV